MPHGLSPHVFTLRNVRFWEQRWDFDTSVSLATFSVMLSVRSATPVEVWIAFHGKPPPLDAVPLAHVLERPARKSIALVGPRCPHFASMTTRFCRKSSKVLLVSSRLVEELGPIILDKAMAYNHAVMTDAQVYVRKTCSWL